MVEDLQKQHKEYAYIGRRRVERRQTWQPSTGIWAQRTLEQVLLFERWTNL